MTNNDILRSLRYTFDFSDNKMIAMFESAGKSVTREQVSQWLKKDEDSDFKNLKDIDLAFFLNGLITKMRGSKEGPNPKPENKLTNNIVFKKLKIALNFKSSDVLEVLDLADLQFSESELTAFFRKPGHKNYRQCKDQILRNFLMGLRLKYRPKE